MAWLLVSLLAALAVATTDALTKKGLQGYAPLEMVAVRLAGPALLLSPLWLAGGLPPLPAAFWGLIAVLVPLEIGALVLYMAAIRDSPLALTLPFLAFTPAFTVVTGFLVLGERITAGGLAGMFLVMAGAYALGVRRRGDGPAAWLAPLRALAAERGSRLMLAVAALYSLTSVMSKAALGHVPTAQFGAFYVACIALPLVLVLAARRPASVALLWRRPAWHLAIAAAGAIEVVAHFTALASTDAAVMLAVKRTSLLFGIGYGALLFGERDLGHHLAAGAVMVAGVALMALG